MSDIFDAGPSMGGMRPKVVVEREGKQWLAKFPTANDPFDVPVIERATLELARECGLQVPQTDLLRLPDGRSVMLIERFDRIPAKSGWHRQHVVSALTLLGLHESQSPTASYADLSHRLTIFAAEGSVARDRAELFQRMVFNILVSNDDDHLRNHAFIWSSAGRGWQLSPLYDVVPNPQIGSERFLHLVIGAHGRLATLDNALSHAAQFGLDPPEAAQMIGEIARKAREWRKPHNTRKLVRRKVVWVLPIGMKVRIHLGNINSFALISHRIERFINHRHGDTDLTLNYARYTKHKPQLTAGGQ